MLPLGIISSILHFLFNFYASRLPKCFILKKNLHRLPGFLFFTKFKNFDLKKNRSVFFREQKFEIFRGNFSKIRKFFNEKSMKIENLKNFENRKFSIFIDFSLKIFQIFRFFSEDFSKFLLSKIYF